MLRKFVRGLALLAIATATLLIVAFAAKPGEKDFISYWSAGHQLVQHHDPYSRGEVYSLELREGLKSAKPLLMRNPPWSLFVVYPLGFLSPRVGLIFWMAAALGAVAFSLRIFQVPVENRLLGFCFAPVYACLAVGQSSPFLLLGFTLFALLHRRRPFCAGAALLFLAMKPHLFLVLLPVILIDSLYRRSYRLLAGAGVALASASVMASCLDPHIWTSYFAMLKTSGIGGEFIPTPVGTLALLIAPEHPTMQFVRCGIAVLWALRFYWKKRDHWNWFIDSMTVLLVTVLVSPYAWMTDEIVLLPAVMLAVAAPSRARYTFAIFMIVNTVALAMLMAQVQLPSGAYAWTSPAWLALYLYSRSGRFSRAVVEYNH